MSISELIKKKIAEAERKCGEVEKMWDQLLKEIRELPDLQINVVGGTADIELLRKTRGRMVICGRYLKMTWNEDGISVRHQDIPVPIRYTDLDTLREIVATWYAR